MIDRTNIGRINALYTESKTIDEALQMFEQGGRINGMLIGGDTTPPPDPESPRPNLGNVMVMTPDWYYPQQMVDAILQKLHDRHNEIDQELASLGVTGSRTGDMPSPEQIPAR